MLQASFLSLADALSGLPGPGTAFCASVTTSVDHGLFPEDPLPELSGDYLVLFPVGCHVLSCFRLLVATHPVLSFPLILVPQSCHVLAHGGSGAGSGSPWRSQEVW